MQDNGTIVTFDSLTNEGSTPLEPNQLYTPVIDEAALVNPEGEGNSITPDESTPIDWEKQFKDTQAALTKSRQEVAALKTKAAELEKQLDVQGIQIPEEIAAELEALKYTDPERWRQSLNELEARRAKEIDTKVAQEVEATRRASILEEYNRNNPGYEINDYVADNILPASFTKRLASGEISFDAFIKEASEYLHNVKIGPGNSPKAGKISPINMLDGGATPNNSGNNPDISYQDAIF